LLNKGIIIVILVLGISFAIISNVSAQTHSIIPAWIKTAISFWVNEQISDEEFLHAIEYFVENEMIIVESKNNDDSIIQNLQTLQTELNEKIRQAHVLANNIQIQNALENSNEIFSEINNPESLIQQLDERWITSDPDDPSSHSYELINNEISDVLRNVMDEDIKSGKQFTYAEIFLTNAYGVNVAQTGKTSDYRQDDELWWQEAKQNGIFFSESGFDESANVLSSDIAVKINDREGRFIGVLKTVINIESVSQEN